MSIIYLWLGLYKEVRTKSFEEFEVDNEFKNDHAFGEFEVKNEFKDDHAFKEFEDEKIQVDPKVEGRPNSSKMSTPLKSSKMTSKMTMLSKSSKTKKIQVDLESRRSVE